ncbi:uncharacterized protein H6S33_011831 [Morchella sextelata]|uniref:uncharacterized protein n=1 Tax=Morchella sextelata TaxID=1174677 RepID=UPI001D0491BC|nr:uncharacterized protein H6S33_011831 [Morchella sextelata]KAH0610304.1 hypothetical protein H6S33_011831 [Morchella sextelata]
MASPHQNPPYAPPSPHSTPTPTPTPQTHYPPPPPPPPFSPFFTLISNPHTTSHKHPVVHYIFADDDIDPLDRDHGRDHDRDRVVIVDVTDAAVTAKSLSRDWQVLGVKVAAAPQWAGETGGGGLMLTVEGTEAPAGKAKGGSMEELEALYQERMALLKRVVEFGGAAGAGVGVAGS